MGAVENAVWAFSKPRWARSVRPQGWQRPHRLRPRGKFQARDRRREHGAASIVGDAGVERRSWSLLSVFRSRRSPRAGGSRALLRRTARPEASFECGGTDVVERRGIVGVTWFEMPDSAGPVERQVEAVYFSASRDGGAIVFATCQDQSSERPHDGIRRFTGSCCHAAPSAFWGSSLCRPVAGIRRHRPHGADS